MCCAAGSLLQLPWSLTTRRQRSGPHRTCHTATLRPAWTCCAWAAGRPLWRPGSSSSSSRCRRRAAPCLHACLTCPQPAVLLCSVSNADALLGGVKQPCSELTKAMEDHMGLVS